jgi:hypothetical protein
MSNHPRLLVDQQVSAYGTLAGEDRQSSESLEKVFQQVVKPVSMLGSLVWIAPPLVLIAMLAISAV